jgi:hypothetical protein
VNQALPAGSIATSDGLLAGNEVNVPLTVSKRQTTSLLKSVIQTKSP